MRALAKQTSAEMIPALDRQRRREAPPPLLIKTCRWPIGEPRDVDRFRNCGQAIARGSYCAEHAALAYCARL
jgi:hypothetical protein